MQGVHQVAVKSTMMGLLLFSTAAAKFASVPTRTPAEANARGTFNTFVVAAPLDGLTVGACPSVTVGFCF